MTKMCRKKAKPRQFFLFNDILVYGNIVINKKKVNIKILICVILFIYSFEFVLFNNFIGITYIYFYVVSLNLINFYIC